jgi:hypothetical protein
LPFQFLLPENLSGSFSLMDKDGDGDYSAKILYTVKAVTFDGCNA